MMENQTVSKFCEICNSEYSDDAKYCTACGSKNVEYTSSIQINEIKEEIKKSKYYNLLSLEEISKLERNPYNNYIRHKICPDCGCKNRSNSQYCEDCGAKLTDSDEEIETINRNVCPHCGAIVYERDKYCAECGKNLVLD